MNAADQSTTHATPAELQHCPRTQFIPIRKADLIESLASDGLTADQARDFRTLCAFLGAYFHHDFYDELTDLKDTHALCPEDMTQGVSFTAFDSTTATVTAW